MTTSCSHKKDHTGILSQSKHGTLQSVRQAAPRVAQSRQYLLLVGKAQSSPGGLRVRFDVLLKLFSDTMCPNEKGLLLWRFGHEVLPSVLRIGLLGCELFCRYHFKAHNAGKP